jgi:hypothetical protein
MIGRLSAFLIVAVLGGAFVAGCGSSSTSSSQSTSTAAPTSPAAAGTTSTSATSTPSGANSAAVQAAVAACKTFQAAPNLPANVKTKVEGVCNKAAGGDLEGARKATKEVCVEVINASPMPSAAKEQALAACKAK